MKYLSIGQRQMIEIGKALMRDARDRVRRADEFAVRARNHATVSDHPRAARKRAIIYVTHRMEECTNCATA